MKEKPYSEEMGWDKWFVFFADERFVERTHADSNCLACEKVGQNTIYTHTHNTHIT